MRLSKDRLQASQTTEDSQDCRFDNSSARCRRSVSYFGRVQPRAIEIYSRRLESSMLHSRRVPFKQATGQLELLWTFSRYATQEISHRLARRRVNILSGRWAKPI